MNVDKLWTSTREGVFYFVIGVMGMDWAVLVSLVSAVSAISGMVLGWIGHARTAKKEVARDAAADADLRTSVNYIRQAVDELRVELRLLRQDYADLVERVAKVEESAKSAHRRIDRLEGRGE